MLTIGLKERSEHKCELCFAEVELHAMPVAPKSGSADDENVVVCTSCLSNYTDSEVDANYWRCLSESMWSQTPAVQVSIYRKLKELESLDWAQDLLGMMYLEESTQEWADTQGVVHLDCNGHKLSAGDTVTLIQDLNVKGSSITAKRGTAVRRIRLDPNNAEYIEGKVDGQHIVILTKYVKKQ